MRPALFMNYKSTMVGEPLSDITILIIILLLVAISVYLLKTIR